ncbi:cellulose biosynthesis cyclic di-GMP-binding regulatory protein BcsB [Cucumibacter marinus]|uniref:cellulose biosynthesis cyclic di-GMP-binding regulatory protein BcsB n=1 Tax=Cucumibacter marinus TaxID=1121252 RepID=UPI000429A6F3|nr:cellulose biosynthesis cyclic di-GMP-binding regulatory protein BcsB [Cucumibacter marinus]
MRDIYRLLLVGGLSLVIVGGAILYSRDSGLYSLISGAVSGPAADTPASSTPPTDLSAPREPLSPYGLTVPPFSRTEWVGLAGFPDSAEFVFPIPGAGSYLGGRLDLEFDAQLADQGDGRLTIAVNGVRRGEIVLNTGRERHHAEIELTPSDLLGGSVSLALAGQGTTNSGQICPADAANSGSAIRLLPQSALMLYADAPLDAVDERLIRLQRPVTLRLSADLADQAAAIWAMRRLTAERIEATYSLSADAADIAVSTTSDEAATIETTGTVRLSASDGVDRLVALRSASRPAAADARWPVMIGQLTDATGLRDFRGSRKWNIDYDLVNLPDGGLPQALDLRMKTSELEEDFEWVLRVALNDNLIDTQRFSGKSEWIDVSIALPADLQRLNNELVIELVDTSPNESICRAGPQAQAQLLPGSTLAGPQLPADGWSALIRDLGNADAIGLVLDAALTPARAVQVSAMLAQVVPQDAPVVFSDAAEAAPVRLKVSTGAPQAPQGRYIVSNGTTQAADRLSLVEADDPMLADVLPGAVVIEVSQ